MTLKLSEFLALVHHETQLVIEYLAQPNLHIVSVESPSAGLVKVEKMQIEIPISVLIQSVKTDEKELAKLPILEKPLLFPGGKAARLDINILEAKSAQTTNSTNSESRLRIEFSVAAK
jgi:hypothetical protein